MIGSDSLKLSKMILPGPYMDTVTRDVLRRASRMNLLRGGTHEELQRLYVVTLGYGGCDEGVPPGTRRGLRTRDWGHESTLDCAEQV